MRNAKACKGWPRHARAKATKRGARGPSCWRLKAEPTSKSVTKSACTPMPSPRPGPALSANGSGRCRTQPRSGRKPTIAPEVKGRILSERPPDPRPAWRAGACGPWPPTRASEKATVQRLWARNDLKPHLTKVFKLSSDPDFEAKFWDVIGLYSEPARTRPGLVL